MTNCSEEQRTLQINSAVSGKETRTLSVITIRIARTVLKQF